MLHLIMFKISSFPPRAQQIAMKHHPNVDADILMDLDETDEEVTAKVSSPGERLTSAFAFMRFVFVFDQNFQSDVYLNSVVVMELTLRMNRLVSQPYPIC